MASVLPKAAGLFVAASAFVGAYQLTVSGADEKPAAKGEQPKDDVPTLKKGKAKGLPTVTGYLGQKEVQEKLKITPEERAKISEAQKAHGEAESKAYAEYEERLHKLLGDDRWKELIKIIDDKRKEISDKKKKGKTEEKKPEEKKPEEKKPE